MLSRVANDRFYVERGIAVCDRWQRFQDFLADLGQPPGGGTLERIDNDGNYEPGNCRWADRREQARNTRRNVFIVHEGRSQTIAAWAEELGIRYWTLYSRHRAGWPAERMLCR
jgi:hypothetical protein